MGFEILDFPCDQFEHQAPGTNEEIVAFCDANFGITFTHYGKIDVNGEHARGGGGVAAVSVSEVAEGICGI
mgnify:CR=1 FL=1